MKLARHVKRVFDRVVGTTSDVWYWRLRHIFEKRRWADDYLKPDSLESTGRKKFVSHVASFAPLSSALEIGCASGPNLVLLAKLFPEARLLGIDVSSHAIKVGNVWLSSHNIHNVSLRVGSALDLRSFADKCVDVIFTNAVLFYVGPDKIQNVVREMVRVAKKAIVLVEWNTDERKSVYRDHWAHNWRALFVQAGIRDISLIKLVPDPWEGFGYIIDVRLD